MKTNIIDLNWNYSKNKATISATVQLTTDADVELWRDGISKTVYITGSAGWYAAAKTELLSQAQKIKDAYVANMALVTTETTKTDVASILADVEAYIEGGLS